MDEKDEANIRSLFDSPESISVDPLIDHSIAN